MRKLSILTVLLWSVASLGATGCSSNTNNADVLEAGYTDVNPEEAKMLIEDNADIIIIDVSPLWAAGHLPGAISYPVGDGSLDTAIPMLDSEATYLVYCHGDEPSMLGAQKLVDAGFEMVYRLAGNYGAWVDAGYDIVVE